MAGVFRHICRIVSVLVLAACANDARVDRAVPNMADLPDLPPMRVFSSHSPQHPIRSNRDLARDFIDLSLTMENGTTLPYLTRFEGPITLRVKGLNPPTLQRDLDDLLHRLRAEAGINVNQVSADQPASITIHLISRAQLRRAVPNVACFVVPNISDWQEYLSNRRSRTTDWRALQRRERVAIFMPGDVSPQDIRDCLHEEIAQSLGPLNDLFRLPDSIFNDDNFHTVLTGSDMLMLRAYYSPRLRSGMTKAQVAAVIPMILAQINPRGERVPYRGASESSQIWRSTMAQALSPKTPSATRRRAIDRAIQQAQDWNDGRLGFALLIKGRLLAADEPQESFENFLAAYQLFGSRPETRLQAAHVATNMAIFALAAGSPEQALILIDAHLDLIRDSENAALLSTMLFAKAEGLRAIGQLDRANTVRQEALGWARYGIGSDEDVRDHEQEIANIARRATCTTQPCPAGG